MYQVMRVLVAALTISVWLLGGIMMRGQVNHPPLTIQRQRIVQSCGASLVATNRATRYSLSGIAGLSAIGFVTAERSKVALGFWVPRDLITFTPEEPDVTAGSRSWAWPNPFVNELYINISMPQAIYARAHVYDMLGNHITDLHMDRQTSQGVKFTWDGVDNHGNPVASGSYLIRVLIRQHAVSQESLLSTVVTCKR